MSCPFDEARYRGLLEGLEVAVVPFSIVDCHKDKRFEAEFYVNEPSAFKNSQIGRVIIPYIQYGTSDELNEESNGYPVLRLNEFDEMFVGKPAKRCSLLDKTSYESLRILKGDVLICRTNGNPALVGRAAVAMVDADAAFASYLFRVRPNAKLISPEVLCVFMNSSAGRHQIERHSIRSNQVNFSPDKLLQISIPVFSSVFQLEIERLVTAAFIQNNLGKSAREQAEQTLLRALGLENWQPPEPLTYTRPSRDAFAAGRLDPEHFKPKYAGLEAHIRATGSFTKLEDLLAINERGTQPDYAESGLAVINSKHVANGEVRLNDDNRMAVAGSSALKIKQGDVLMNGTGVGTIGRVAPFLHDAKALPDNHVTVLRPKAGLIDPVYLSVYLNSLAGQYQVNKWLRGSSGQIELYPNDIAQFLVWIAPTEVQQAIRKAVDDAYAAKRNATKLLDAARRAVETAIEQSEAAALAWLDKTVAALNQPVAGALAPCDHPPTPEPDHDPQTTPTPGTPPEGLARNAPGRGQSARGVSLAGARLHAELDGAGTRAGGAGASGNPAQSAVDSTRPLDATRELATAAGSLTYTEVSERLAVNIVHCLDDLLDANPEDIAFTPDWIRDLHRRLAGELFPEWGGRFRTTDVQVGTHLPPPAHAVAVEVSNFCLDLQERMRHLSNAEAIADLLAWVDWRFQWIHPFKDFNGRVGRILLVALAYKLGLPPVDPAADEDKSGYFAALRAADAGDLLRLRELWLARLET